MKKGFTLIELAVVSTVIGILYSALIPKLTSFKERAGNTRAVKQVVDITTALEAYKLYNNKYPVSPTCNGIVKTDCTLSGIKSMIPEYLSSVPDGNNGATGWILGSGNFVPFGKSYGYVGGTTYYAL